MAGGKLPSNLEGALLQRSSAPVSPRHQTKTVTSRETNSNCESVVLLNGNIDGNIAEQSVTERCGPFITAAIGYSDFSSRPEANGGNGSEDFSPTLGSDNIPSRKYDCPNYETCLSLAAALNWDSFVCQGCCGKVNSQLLWRARQKIRQDSTLRSFCDLPEINGQQLKAPSKTKLRLVR